MLIQTFQNLLHVGYLNIGLMSVVGPHTHLESSFVLSCRVLNDLRFKKQTQHSQNNVKVMLE